MCIVEEILNDPAKGTRRLVAEYRNRLFQVAYRLCFNAHDAEDLMFRTFHRAVERISTCQSQENIFPWLYSILVNFWRMDLRRKMPNALDLTEEIPDRPDERPDAGTALEAAEDVYAVRAALRALSTPFREVVVFRYFEDLSIPEIARILNLSEGTVKSRLNRAKWAMRRYLTGTFHFEGASTDGGEIR